MTQTKPPILDASAVIFDVDGTLVDSVDFHAEAWQRAFSAFGFEFDLIAVRSQIGKGGDQLLPVFLDGDNLEKKGKQIEAYRQDLFEREYFHRVVGFPKVPELFKFLIDAGKTIALGSSAKTDDLEVYKKAAGIDGLTTVETTSDDAERSKPHPDIFIAALDRLKLSAETVVVVGDTPYDVEAAKKSGMRATGLLCGGFSEDSLRRAGAVDVYRDPGHMLEVLEAADTNRAFFTETTTPDRHMTSSSRLTAAMRSTGAKNRHRAGWAILVGAGMAGAALVNQRLATKAERDNPPKGQFVEVDGVRLHYLDRGHGEPVVLIHGNGSMVEDFKSSGLVDMASAHHRVVAFDRPGFGHSERPRTTVWTQNAQADLIFQAMAKIGVVRATVVGHSWGCSVALALAERHPKAVKALVLASGYYFPSARSDVVTTTTPAIPIVGDVIAYTLSPVLSRAMWPQFLSKVFGPEKVPEKFDSFPKEMAFRPSQIRASAADTALMIPDAVEASSRYGSITTQTVIIAGTEDGIVDHEAQSVRLNDVLPSSCLHLIRGAGHMIQQTATDALMAAIDEASDMHLRGKPKVGAEV